VVGGQKPLEKRGNFTGRGGGSQGNPGKPQVGFPKHDVEEKTASRYHVVPMIHGVRKWNSAVAGQISPFEGGGNVPELLVRSNLRNLDDGMRRR
jgi:hypothetical protein